MAMGVGDQSRNFMAFKWLGSLMAGGGNAQTKPVQMFSPDANGSEQAAKSAAARGMIRWKLPGYSAWIVSSPSTQSQATAMATGGQSGGGAGSAGGAIGGSGQAAAAVQAGLPGYTGGGPSFQQGAIDIASLASAHDDDFKGLDALYPPEKLSAGYTPDGINWDGFAKYGSRCVRRGCAKMGDDAATLSINSALRGLSLAAIPADFDKPEQLLAAFADADILSTRAAVQTLLHVLTSYPQWGRPTSLVGWPGPLLTLSDLGSQVLRANTAYTNAFDSTNQAGFRANSVVGLVVRYSTVYYPADIDGFDETVSTALKNRTAWTGASQNNDSGTLTAARYFCTAWAISREGYSEPSFASKTLA